MQPLFTQKKLMKRREILGVGRHNAEMSGLSSVRGNNEEYGSQHFERGCSQVHANITSDWKALSPRNETEGSTDTVIHTATNIRSRDKPINLVASSRPLELSVIGDDLYQASRKKAPLGGGRHHHMLV